VNYGEFSEELHRRVGDEVVKNKIDILVVVGEDAKHIGARAKELGMDKIYECNNNQETTQILNEIIKENDAILLKASNGMKFIEILESLRK